MATLRAPALWNARFRGRVRWSVLQEALGRDLLRQTVGAAGAHMVGRDYTGPEITPLNPSRKLSTTLSAALSGWLSLSPSDPTAALEGARCAGDIIRSQEESGAWLFPYPFRKNGPDHAYACENLMTLGGLLDAMERGADVAGARRAIEKGVAYLLEQIGWADDGAFWYSATDHIYVPNIASMAASVLARAASALSEPALRGLAERAFDYCVKTQGDDGAYPYFTGQAMVYIPYHALQLWHMCIASRALGGELHSSIHSGMRWLDAFLARYGYCPTNEKATPWVAKTPLWVAMANLQYGRRNAAVWHYLAAHRLFWDREQGTFFYTLDVRPRVRRRTDTVYLWYVASAFEIGAAILTWGESGDQA